MKGEACAERMERFGVKAKMAQWRRRVQYRGK